MVLRLKTSDFRHCSLIEYRIKKKKSLPLYDKNFLSHIRMKEKFILSIVLGKYCGMKQ